jgi:response regulator RpfG family c-di-GMP phosphodiesterase
MAESGEAGLAYIAQEKIDMVISDMSLPGMSGAEFLAKAAIQSPNSYRILLAGLADMEPSIEATKIGKIHRYIAKPWNHVCLLSAIYKEMDTVRLKRDNSRLEVCLRK